MKRKQRNQFKSVTPVTPIEINSPSNQDDKILEINLGDIFDQVNYNTTLSYELTLEILSSLRFDFNDIDCKTIKTNSFYLMEFIHYIIIKTISKLQKPKYEKIDDVVKFNFNMIIMFLEPFNIKEEEIEWVQNCLLKKSDGKREVEIIIPEDARQNYYIHLKRVLDENVSNPEFNQSILEYLKGTVQPE